jgi:hypothetical protein
MVGELMEYRRRVTETEKAGEDNEAAAQQCAKEVAEVLTEVSETAAQKLAKLMQPLSMSTQLTRNTSLPL